MKKITFEKLVAERDVFLNDNANLDHVVITGNNNVLISAPHGVEQTRNGKSKVYEPGSVTTGLYLQKQTGSFFIAKTKNNNDDANYDEQSSYKDSIKDLIRADKIKYIIDLHGLAETRECEINLGINGGKNVSNNIELFNDLNTSLMASGFNVFIDEPFSGGDKTISGSLKNEFCDIWTIQIEIRCDITNKKENFEHYKTLLKVLENWIGKIK